MSNVEAGNPPWRGSTETLGQPREPENKSTEPDPLETASARVEKTSENSNWLGESPRKQGGSPVREISRSGASGRSEDARLHEVLKCRCTKGKQKDLPASPLFSGMAPSRVNPDTVSG